MRTLMLILTTSLLTISGCKATPDPKNAWDTDQAIREARTALRRNNIYFYDLGTIACPSSREIEHKGRTVVVPIKLLHCGCEIDSFVEYQAKHQYAETFNSYILKNAFR